MLNTPSTGVTSDELTLKFRGYYAQSTSKYRQCCAAICLCKLAYLAKQCKTLKPDTYSVATSQQIHQKAHKTNNGRGLSDSDIDE